MVYCKKIVAYILNYKIQISSFNHMAQDILTNEIYLVLPHFSKDRKEKRGIITLLVTGFIGLKVFLVFLHNRRYKALLNVVTTVENKVNIQ